MDDLFKVDHSQATEMDFSPLVPGDYEFFITGAKPTEAGTGTQGVAMVLTVRDDIEQAGAGKKVWHTVWYTPNTKGIVQGFYKKLNIPSDTVFTSLQDIANAIKGLPIRARVRIQASNDQYNEVVSFMESRVGGRLEIEDTEPSSDNVTDISDIQFPFV